MPAISTYEMQLRLPHPEILYTAASEVEWKRLLASTAPDESPLFSVLMELLLSGLLDQSQMPRTLIGKFAVIHGTSSTSPPHTLR